LHGAQQLLRFLVMALPRAPRLLTHFRAGPATEANSPGSIELTLLPAVEWRTDFATRLRERPEV
jgi:hypothetical protein